MTLSIKEFSIKALTQHNDTQPNDIKALSIVTHNLMA